MSNAPYTVLTRDDTSNRAWRRQLEHHGAHIYELPCVHHVTADPTEDIAAMLERLYEYHWIVFADALSAQHFLDLVSRAGIGLRPLTGAWIATSDHATADMLKSLGLVVSFIPSRPDSVTLGREIKRIKSRRILLPHAGPTTHTVLGDTLRRRSGDVSDLFVTRPAPRTDPDDSFMQLVRQKQVGQLVFASHSAVTGFIHRVSDPVTLELARELPAVAVGNTVRMALEQAYFRHIRHIDQPTAKAILGPA
jgi:uroporphyrinogen III methyltransferase/synthase